MLLELGKHGSCLQIPFNLLLSQAMMLLEGTLTAPSASMVSVYMSL